MNHATRDSLVTGYEALIPSLGLPDPNDRHVLAAAIVGRCDVIVTQNLKDSPQDALEPYGIETLHPDDLSALPKACQAHVFSQEHAIPTKPIAKRQRYWLDHLNNAAASGCTLVTYARNPVLKARDLYFWKGNLGRTERIFSAKNVFKPGFQAAGYLAGLMGMWFILLIPRLQNLQFVTMYNANGRRVHRLRQMHRSCSKNSR